MIGMSRGVWIRITLLISMVLPGCQDGPSLRSGTAMVTNDRTPLAIVGLEQTHRLPTEVSHEVEPQALPLLGYIRDIDEGNSGSIIVVDSDTKLVVELPADGGQPRRVAGGYGNEPGLFVRPVQVDLSPESDIYVLDSTLRRVTRFDRDGQLLSVIETSVTDPFGLAVRGSELYVLRSFQSKDISRAVMMYDTSGAVQDSVFSIGRRERYFSLAFTGVVHTTRDGAVLFGHPQPGLWSELLNRTATVRGAEALPERETYLVEIQPNMYDVISPGGTIAVGDLAEGKIGVFWATQERVASGASSRLEMTYYLDVFDRSGAYLGTSDPIEGEFFSAVAFGSDGTSLYAAVKDPAPQVLVFRIIVSPRSPEVTS